MRQFLEPEDYLEPVCVLCDPTGESGKKQRLHRLMRSPEVLSG